MNTDDMLVEQAARNKARNPTARVFVYRNIVKALPWYLYNKGQIAKLEMMRYIYSVEITR